MALLCRNFTHARMHLGTLKSKGAPKLHNQSSLDTHAVLSLLDKRNVLYVGHIADTDNESLFKVGITYRLPQRHASHCRSFPAFDLHTAVAYDRHRQVEDMLLEVARHKDMLRPYRSKDGKAQREVIGVPKHQGSIVIIHYLEALIATDAVATHVANGAYVDNANAWGPTSCRKVAPHWTREGFAAPSKKLTVIVGQPYHMKNKEWAKYKQEKRIINFNCNAPKGKSCVIDATLLQTSGINPSMPFSKTVNIHYKPTETDRTFEVKYVYLKK